MGNRPKKKLIIHKWEPHPFEIFRRNRFSFIPILFTIVSYGFKWKSSAKSNKSVPGIGCNCRRFEEVAILSFGCDCMSSKLFDRDLNRVPVCALALSLFDVFGVFITFNWIWKRRNEGEAVRELTKERERKRKGIEKKNPNKNENKNLNRICTVKLETKCRRENLSLQRKKLN